MCAEHEATTTTQPRNGIRIRCHDDDLRFETIIASKSTMPAIQSRPTSTPKRGPPCVDVSLHRYGHQYSPTDTRSLRPPYFHQQTPADHEACCLTCVNVGARRRNRFRSVLAALPSAVFNSGPVGGPNTPESNMWLYRQAREAPPHRRLQRLITTLSGLSGFGSYRIKCPCSAIL